jgi:hypothetical protein
MDNRRLINLYSTEFKKFIILKIKKKIYENNSL